ncbi:hypothetical protein COU89_03725, partial [Candidatus Roizmanbacteria bacterium CG10_big_fil_rev_8_21_14_0_10_45_7]
SAVIPSMILAMIGGVILVLQFVINSYVWVGESIMKLTTNQFNIFWLDYGGFAAITFSLLTCVLYFTFFSAINAFQKR